MKPIPVGGPAVKVRPHHRGWIPALLSCGVASSALYVLMNIIGPMEYPGYDWRSQTVSELSAVGAPTRPLWAAMGALYDALIVAFGVGLFLSHVRKLKTVGYFVLGQGAVSLFWPPMQMRGEPFATTDALHIVWSVATLTIMVFAICYGAMAFGKRFRVYSWATLTAFFVFGLLTGIESPKIAANLPTPWIGVWERINIAAYMLWLAVFAVLAIREVIHNETT